MTDLIANLGLGIATAITPANMLYCLLGVSLGTLVGVLPGLGPVATISMLLPATYAVSPTAALIMLSGIYYGAQYGGSTTAILINLPGEASSAVTALDGYHMARQGRAGTALAIAAIGSFVAGTISTLLMALFAPPLADIALKFGPAEYFSLMLAGLIASIVLARGSLIKALGMALMGMLLGLVGSDVETGIQRFTFDIRELADGIGIVLVGMALFGIAEIMLNLENEAPRTLSARVERILPNLADLKRSANPILRGTFFGAVLGILPGGGAILASFGAYALEKKLSDDPSRFGRGAIEGVAAPEAANNAGAQTSFIPMLTLGIPSNPVMALMIGAMVIQGIQPGPAIINDQPGLFWGIIVSMWLGNLFLLVLNLPMIRLWIGMLLAPYHLLFPTILVFSAIGVFSVSNNILDVYLLAGFSVLGYILIKLDCEPAPLLLGFILGPMMKENLRTALILSRGDPAIFVERPISAGLLAFAALGLLAVMAPVVRNARQETFVE